MQHFTMPSLVSSENDVCEMSAEIWYWWRVNTQIWVVLLIVWSKLSANQTLYPELGSERSPVWNFCPHFPDVIFQGNQLWLREMSAVLSGYYKKGWKWLPECIFNSLYNLCPSLVQWNPTLWPPQSFGHLVIIATFFCGPYISLLKKTVNVVTR